MTVAQRSPVTVTQRPTLRLVQRASPARRMRVRLRWGLRSWIVGLAASWRLIAWSLALLAPAMVLDYYSGAYVTAARSVGVPDLILDRFEAVDLSFLFVYGYMALIVGLFSYPLLFRPRLLHVVIIQFSLLLVLRSLFMMFTHLQTPPGSIPVGFPSFFGHLYFENDMFFSGHTAFPFLGFYLFRRSTIRYVFLVGSITMGIVVLAMHIHYSIDVLAAFFMTYCSYRMGRWVLRRFDPAYGE
jgi:hypothetical protein